MSWLTGLTHRASACVGFAWPSLGRGVLPGGLLWQAARSFLHVQQSQTLAGPKMDVLLVKAGPITNGGNTSAITY